MKIMTKLTISTKKDHMITIMIAVKELVPAILTTQTTQTYQRTKQGITLILLGRQDKHTRETLDLTGHQ